MSSITYTAAANSSQNVLSIDTLLESMARVQAAPRSAYGACFDPKKVQTTLHAVRTEPIKVHKHRHSQTEAYHKRTQKKWTKRYGTKQVPCAYVIDTSMLGGLGHTLVTHPSLLMGWLELSLATE